MAGALIRRGQQERGTDGRPLAQTQQESPVMALRRELGKRQKRIAALFPGPRAEDAANRVCAMAVIQFEKMITDGQNPTLGSVIDAVMLAAQYGLEIVGDQAYLVPYKGKAQLIVGPGGLITMAARENMVAVARCVFEGDDFDYDLGTGMVRHKKATENRRPTKRSEIEERVVYAWAKVTRIVGRDEQPVPILEVLTAEDIAFYRSFSKAPSGPWFDNFEGMARKTVLKRAMAFAPKSMVLSWALSESDTGAAETMPVLDDVGANMLVDGQAPALTQGTVSASVPLSDEEHAKRIDRGEEPQRERQPGED